MHAWCMTGPLKDAEVRMLLHSNPGELAEACLGWSSKPAMTVDAAPWTDNIFHFFNDFLMPVFETAHHHGWISPDQYADGQRAPSPDDSPVTLIALTPWPYKVGSHNYFWLCKSIHRHRSCPMTRLQIALLAPLSVHPETQVLFDDRCPG